MKSPPTVLPVEYQFESLSSVRLSFTLPMNSLLAVTVAGSSCTRFGSTNGSRRMRPEPITFNSASVVKNRCPGLAVGVSRTRRTPGTFGTLSVASKSGPGIVDRTAVVELDTVGVDQLEDCGADIAVGLAAAGLDGDLRDRDVSRKDDFDRTTEGRRFRRQALVDGATRAVVGGHGDARACVPQGSRSPRGRIRPGSSRAVCR